MLPTSNLEEFFKKKKEQSETPLMLDQSYFPESGTVTFDPKDPSKGKPISGGYINKQGKAEVKIPGIGVGAVAKEKAQAVKPELQAVADSTSKVTEQKIAEIKAQLGIQSPVAEVSVEEAQPAVAQAPGKIDLKAIRDQVEAEGPRTGLTDILLGLIPVALDAATGGYGAALDTSGKYYLDKAKSNEDRKNKLEDFLLQAEKSRMVAGAKAAKGMHKRFQSVNIVDPATLQSIKANFDTTTGEYSLPDGQKLNSDRIRAAYSVIPEEFNRRTDYRPRLDPETGRYSRIEGGQFAPIGQQTMPLNPKQEKDLTNVVNKFITTDAYKKPALAIQTSTNIDNLLATASSGNPTAAGIAIKEIAKMAEGGGRLSDQDVTMVQGSQSFKAKAKRFANLQKTDLPLTPKELEDLREVAQTIGRDARRKLQSSIGGLETSYIENYGGVSGAVGKAMSPYVPGLYDEPAQPKPAAKKPAAKKSGYVAPGTNKSPPPGLTKEQFFKWMQENG